MACADQRPAGPSWEKMLDNLVDGNEFVVWKLDCLGRNTR